ncbi:MAG: serine hydrolase domain-containing protein [Caldilineaceae bacterium]
MDLVTYFARATQQSGTAAVALIDSRQTDPAVTWTPPAQPIEPCFLAYSITKTFTAALVLRLQEKGLLTIDAPLAKWLPAVPQADVISLRQLLNHTAGIPDYGSLPAYHAAVRATPAQAWRFEQFTAVTFANGLAFAPGTGWAYSNPGYMLLKRVAEMVAEKPFATLLAEEITAPLGLARTFVPQEVADLAPLAPAPSKALSTTDERLDTRLHYHPGWVSHGVVASPPSEIARFYHALFGGQLLTAASLQEMTTLIRVPGEHRLWGEPSYGLGIMGDPASPVGLLWGHNGGGPGYSASAFHAPNLNGRAVTVCVMSASEGGFAVEEVVVDLLKRLNAT